MNDPHFKFERYPLVLDRESRYCGKTALFLAVMCHLAYQKRQKVLHVVRRLNGRGRFICKKKSIDVDTQCFAAEFENDVLVSFRGSWQWQDWLTNVQYHPVNGPLYNNGRGKVHKGMWDALTPALNDLFKFLDTCDLANKSLWLTGHSLGGGLANLFAGVLREKGIRVTGLYTFATPKVADDYHASCIDNSILGPHYRLENKFDPVPDLPPSRLVNYHHSGQLIDIQDRSYRHFKSWPLFKANLKAIRRGKGKGFSIPNIYHRHNLNSGYNSYIPRLSRQLGKSSL